MKKVDSNEFSLESKGLKYKLRISVYLTIVLPLLMCIYLVSRYILPDLGLQLDISVIISLSLFVAWVGFYFVKETFNRILYISAEAKLIASGDINHHIEITHKDEIGDLGEALNQLTGRIRSNIDELKGYSQRTKDADSEIDKRISVLSTLLEISSFISQGTKLENILRLIVDKAQLLADSSAVYMFFRREGTEIFFPKIADGINAERILQIKIGPEDAVFNKLVNSGEPLVIDEKKIAPERFRKAFHEKIGLKNTIALPVYLKGEVAGILGIGNTQDVFSYKDDDMELLDIFAKQLAIALENDTLTQRLEKLEVVDMLTGLYNEIFIRNRLEEEIRRAIVYQRPCAFILLDISVFQNIRHNFGLAYAEAVLKKTAVLIKSSISEIDRAARMGDGGFAIVLPEKNKRQARKIAEDLKKKIEFSFSEEEDVKKRIAVNVGVSENPLDGINSNELITKAFASLDIAKA